MQLYKIMCKPKHNVNMFKLSFYNCDSLSKFFLYNRDLTLIFNILVCVFYRLHSSTCKM